MPSEPQSAHAVLSIIRDTADDVQDRWIRVWLDGEAQDVLRYGTTWTRPITPGHHVIKVSNTLSRDTYEFDAAPDELIKLRCHNAIARGGFLTILMIGVGAIRVRLERIAA
jgi:hypothetical protein